MRKRRATFVPDFYVEALRDSPRLSSGRVLRILADRAAWLAKKIEERSAAAQPSSWFIDELKAIVQAAESVSLLRSRRKELSSDQGSKGGDAHGQGQE